MQRSPEGGAIVFPQADATLRSVPHPRKMASAVWENDSTGTLATVPSALSPESLCPPSAGAKGECPWMKFCVLALLEGACIPVDSGLSLTDRNANAFHSQMFCGHLFLTLVF